MMQVAFTWPCCTRSQNPFHWDTLVILRVGTALSSSASSSFSGRMLSSHASLSFLSCTAAATSARQRSSILAAPSEDTALTSSSSLSSTATDRRLRGDRSRQTAHGGGWDALCCGVEHPGPSSLKGWCAGQADGCRAAMDGKGTSSAASSEQPPAAAG